MFEIKPKPKEALESIAGRVPAEVYRKLDILAKKNNTNKSDIVSQCVVFALDNMEDD